MTRSTLLLSTLLVGAALAGCLQTPADVDTAATGVVGDLLGAKTPLWLDPQNAPHGAFGWPTLTNPVPADAAAPQWWQPIPAAPALETITGMEHVTALGDEIAQGGGISLFGGLAVVPGYSTESYTVDISTPDAPKVVGTMEGYHRGSAIIAYPDGRLMAVFSGGGQIDVYDITDPTMPELASTVEVSSHKLGVVPGTPIVYNSNGDVYDLTDPTAPVKVLNTGDTCHHIFFWNDASQEKYRALCAGYEETVIFDTLDPRAPVEVVRVPHFHGNPTLPSNAVTPVTFSHTALLSADGTVLIVGDEMGGGGVPPGCGARAGTPVRDVTTPLGALWFYDVSDETDPQLLGWFSPGHHLDPTRAQASCTAHHGRLVPDPEGRDLLAMGFYGAGVVLVDFTDASAPRMVDQWNDGTNTWEAWHYNGWIFTGDLLRGMDVLKLA